MKIKLFVLVFFLLVSQCFASLIPYPFNGAIVKNRGSIHNGIKQSSDYSYIDITDDDSTAYSGANSSEWVSDSHTYAYSLKQSNDFFETTNTTGNEIVSMYDTGKPVGSLSVIRDTISLSGSLLLAKDVSYHGLMAKATIKVVWDFDWWGMFDNLGYDYSIPINVLYGDIILAGYGNRVNFFSTGNLAAYLNKNTVTIDATDDYYKISFDDISVPYWVLAKEGCNIELNNKIVAYTYTKGYGTGAEVHIGDEGVIVPEMQRRGIVAEPSTLILLGAGGLLMFGFPVSVAYLKNRSRI